VTDPSVCCQDSLPRTVSSSPAANAGLALGRLPGAQNDRGLQATLRMADGLAGQRCVDRRLWRCTRKGRVEEMGIEPPAPAAKANHSAARMTGSRVADVFLALAITVLIYVYRDQLSQLGSYGYLGLFVVSAVGNATVLLPIPSLAATFLAGGVLNPLLSGVVSGAGMAVGEMSGYLAGYGGTAIIEKKETKAYERLEGWMRRHGSFTIFVLSAIPNPVFDLAGIAAGMLQFPVRRFLVACFLGKTVKGIVFALAGAQAQQWAERFVN